MKKKIISVILVIVMMILPLGVCSYATGANDFVLEIGRAHV